MLLYIILILLSIVFIDQSAGKVQQGTLNTKKNFVFLGSFAFGTENANLEYEIGIHAVNTPSGYDLIIFDDTIGQWGSIRPHQRTLTCAQKVSKITDSKFKISLTEGQNGCEIKTVHKEEWLRCKGDVDFSTVKTPRHYFIHLTNCNSHREKTGILNLQYRVHMTNGQGPFHHEFSFDQRFILQTNIGFLIAYIGIFVIGTANYIALSKKHFLHITYRLFYLSLLLQVISLILHCCAQGAFSQDGLGLPWMTDTADIIYCLSSILFVIILLLVSKGYSITRVEVSLAGSIKLTVFAVLYAAAYLMVLIYQNIIFDPRDILNFYGSLAASGLIACRLSGLLWTLYGVIFTVKTHPSKVPFYLHFGLFFTVWFLAEPVNIYMAAYIIPKMDSSFISNGVQWGTALVGHTYFLFLTRLGTINERFPFHLPTRKVNDSSFYFSDLDARAQYDIPDDFYNGCNVEQHSTIIGQEDGGQERKSEPQTSQSAATTKDTTHAVVAPAPITATTWQTTCPVHLFLATSAVKELGVRTAVLEAGEEPYEQSPVLPLSSSFQSYDIIDDISDDVSMMSLPIVDEDGKTISPVPSLEYDVETSAESSSLSADVFNKPLPGDRERMKKSHKAKLPRVPSVATRHSPVHIFPPVGKQTQLTLPSAWPTSANSKETRAKHLKKLVKNAKQKLHAKQETVPTIPSYLDV